MIQAIGSDVSKKNCKNKEVESFPVPPTLEPWEVMGMESGAQVKTKTEICLSLMDPETGSIRGVHDPHDLCLLTPVSLEE